MVREVMGKVGEVVDMVGEVMGKVREAWARSGRW